MYWMWQVSWPLELIANTEAVKKYNQVIFSTSGFVQGVIFLVLSNCSMFYVGDGIPVEGQACKICSR